MHTCENRYTTMSQQINKQHNPDIEANLTPQLDLELHDGLLQTSYKGLQMVSMAAAVVYLLLAVAHQFFLPPPASWIMTALAATTSIVSLLLSRITKARPALNRLSYQLWIFLFALFQINGLVHLYFDAQPFQTTNLILINMAVGFAVFSSRWVGGLYILTTLAWLSLAAIAPPSDQWAHFYFAYFEGLIVAILIHIVRKRSVRDHILKEIHLQEQNIQLMEARQAAETAAKAKSVFLASMSHELRTPLNSIIGYSEIIQSDLESHPEFEETCGDVHSIHSAGKHLLSVINDVLNLAKVESDQISLDIQSIRVADLIDDAVQTALPLMQKNGNQFTWNDVDESLTMRTDPIKLKQILLNLLGNAAKFTKNGQVTLKITPFLQGNQIEFRIKDSGIGIPADLQGHLFEPFWQADGSFSREYEGTGLGLAISDQFCRLLGGEILVQSQENEGATFSVYLPLTP